MAGSLNRKPKVPFFRKQLNLLVSPFDVSPRNRAKETAQRQASEEAVLNPEAQGEEPGHEKAAHRHLGWTQWLFLSLFDSPPKLKRDSC